MWGKGKVKVLVISCVQLFVTPRTVLLPGSCVHWVSQARILEWVAMPSSRGSSRPRDGTHVSCIGRQFFTVWATREAQSWEKQDQVPRKRSSVWHSLNNDCPACGSLSQTPVDDEGPSWLLSLQHIEPQGRRFSNHGGALQPQNQTGKRVHPCCAARTTDYQRGLEWGAGRAGTPREQKKRNQSVHTLLLSHVCLGHIKWRHQTKQKLRPPSSRHMRNGLRLQQLSQKEATESDISYIWAAEASSPSSPRWLGSQASYLIALHATSWHDFPGLSSPSPLGHTWGLHDFRDYAPRKTCCSLSNRLVSVWIQRYSNDCFPNIISLLARLETRESRLHLPCSNTHSTYQLEPSLSPSAMLAFGVGELIHCIYLDSTLL